MPRRANRMATLLSAARWLLPAWLLSAVAAAIDHPLSLVPLLLANAVVMTAVCRALGFDTQARFTRSLARRGLAYFVESTTYTALVAALLAGPALWLSLEGSLPAALGLSAALALSLFALWRVWPAFVLPFVWDDAYPHGTDSGSWLLTALRRSLSFARHLTRGHEFLFTCGVPAAAGLLALAVGALVLAGLGGFLDHDIRVAAFVLYAGVVSPLVHALVANRCLRVLLADARSRRRQATQPEPGPAPQESCNPVLPAGIGQSELDATLLCAAHSAQTSLALAALERGANPDAAPASDQRDQRTPLMIAVALPDLRLLRALIARGVDVNRLHGGITPLIAATRDSHEGRPEAVTTLLANGADPRLADASGSTPLHHAARCAQPAIAALLLDAGAAVDALDGEAQTALCIACASANWSIAAFLLESGARPDAPRAQPALLFAASVADDDPAGVRLLLKHRARADARAALERTPLMAAALAGHPRIVETLLGAGAEVDCADERGTTALMEAARSGSVAVIHALGKRKPDPDRRDASGRTALIIACQSRHAGEEAVRALLALGADRELQASDGRRALDHAAAAGRWHIVALLDSAYPLPSSFGETVPAQRASADHLLDALRFGHWNVAAEFVGVLGEWPAEALASMYLELTGEDEGPARQWLLNRRLGTDDAVHANGRLLEALVERLPASCMALAELVERGVPVGGAGLVGRVLARAPAGAPGAGVRRLAMRLVERGADAFGCVADGQSPLHFAVQAGDRALVDRLLAAGAHPDARDAQGRTPLHVAAAAAPVGDCSLVRQLVAAGANPEIATAQGETALGIALARAQPDAAAWLGWTGWPLPLRPLRPSDLAAAAHVGDGDAVDRLLQLGFPIDSEDAQGATALVRAAGAGHAALVVRLLGAGADAAHASHGGVHCLAAAVSARREPVVRTLLSHGMAPDTRLAGAATPLMLAAALGDPRIAEALLEAGADAKASDGQGTTPLHAAAQQAFHAGDTAAALALFALLLDAGADPRALNRAGQDPLLLLLGAAAQPGTRCDADHLRRLAECLLQRGAGIDVQDQRGVSALHACALHGLSGCARLLKSHGAPLDAVDGFGRNAADVAALLGYVDVAAELGLARALPLPGARQTLRRPARAPD